MTDKEKKNKIADVLLDFYDEYDSNVINRPMIPNIYAGRILDSMQEEPVSEELEDAAYEFVMNNFGNPKEPLYKFDQRCFRAGANWQKQQDSIQSKDLEELINTLSNRYPEVSFAKLSRIAVHVANWQKQKTLDKACNFLEMLGQGFTITDEITHTTYKVEQLITDFKTYMED